MVEPRGIHVDVVLPGRPAEARYLLDAREGSKLLLKDPVLDFLLTHQVVVRTVYDIAIDLAYWVVRRDGGRHALGQRGEGEAVDGLDAVPVIVTVPREVALDVGKAVK